STGHDPMRGLLVLGNGGCQELFNRASTIEASSGSKLCAVLHLRRKKGGQNTFDRCPPGLADCLISTSVGRSPRSIGNSATKCPAGLQPKTGQKMEPTMSIARTSTACNARALTLADLARTKCLSIDFLRSIGLSDLPEGGVAIQ